MPIKGLSDRGLAFPEIGQIRKGAAKDPAKNMPGHDLTYFRAEFDEKETEAAATFKKYYGDQPNEIRVILPFNEIERMWDPWLEAYTAGRMIARSDGERFIYLVDTKTGEIVVKNGLDINGQIHPYTDGMTVGNDYQNKPIKCKPVGRLKVIIPELARAAYMTVMTTSIHDIANISNQLAAFQELNNGQIAGIPFVLRRRPKKVSRPEGNKRVRTEKWLLSIEADPEWVKAKLMQVKHLALPGNGFKDETEPELTSAQATQVEYEPEEPDEDIPSEPEMSAPEPVEQPVPMEVMRAMAMTRDTDKKPYGELDEKELTQARAGLGDLLAKETDAKRQDRIQEKLNDIETILKYRAEMQAAVID